MDPTTNAEDHHQYPDDHEKHSTVKIQITHEITINIDMTIVMHSTIQI